MSKIRAMRRKSVLVAAVAAAAASSWSQVAPAATRTWNGGGLDGNWTTPLNWVGGAATVAGDALVFDGFGRLTTNTNNFPAATAFSGINFAATAGGFTLSGNQIDLTGNLADDTAVLTQVVNNNLIFGATRDVSVANATGTLRLGGIVSGAGGIHKLGEGILILGGANTFTGAVDIGAGRLQIGADNNLGAAPGAATANQLIIDGIGGVLQTTATFTLNANRGIALGPAGGAGTGVIDVNSGTTLTYNGIIANNTGGTGGLVKTSFGTLSLGAANTYSGSTQLKNGNITLNFAATSAPASDIINPVSNLVIGGATSGLGQQSNATLLMTGKLNTANVQSFASTHVDLYGSVIQATKQTGTGTSTLNLGTLTRTLGGTLVVGTNGTAADGTTVVTNQGVIKTTTVVGANGILGGWAIAGAPSTPGNRGITAGTDWATVDGGGNIVTYTGYTPATVYTGADIPTNPPTAPELADATLLRNQAGVNANANVRYVGGGTSDEVRVDQPFAGRTTDINTFAFTANNGANNTLGINHNNTLRLGVNGGIFKQNTANAQMYIGGWNNGQPITGNGQGANIGSVTAGGTNDNTPGEIVLTLNETANNNGSLNVLAKIVDNGTGPVTLIKTGVASVKIDGHNTYSGGTFINQGRFQMAGGEPGDPNPDGLGTGRVTVAPGGYLFISSVNSATVYTGRGALTGENPVGGTAQNAPVLNDMTLSGNGTSQEAGGSIRFGNRSVLLGELTLAGDTRWCAGNGVNYNTRINTDGTLYVDPGNDIRGRITGPGALDFGGRAVAGFQGQISSTANDWSGQTTLLPSNGNANLRLGNDEVIPHGIGKGNLNFGDGANSAILDMNGHSETVNGLSTAASTNLAGAIIQNNGFTAVVVDPTPGDPVNNNDQFWGFTSPTSTLTVGAFDQSATFGGIIRDSDTSPSVTLPNPKYVLVDNDNDPNTPPVDLEGDPATISVAAPWANPTNGGTAAKVAFTKIGTGVQTLSGANTYTGPTTITGGVLAVNGSLHANSAVSVSGAGSAIGGTGTIGAVTATSGGGVSPGASGLGSIGTLSMSSLNMTNGDLKIDFGATTDNISVSGAANFAGANTITPSGAAVTGTYTILNAAGGVTGGNTLTLGSFPFIPDSRPASGVVLVHANDVQVQVTGAKILTWTGATNGNWALGAAGPLNWVDPTPTAERFFNADTVAFTDSGTNRAITLNTTIQPGNVTFTHGSGPAYVISGTGSIIGLTGVTMSGGGQATIATNNTFTGQVRVTGGRLTLSGSNTPASVNVNGGQFVAAGAITTGSTALDSGEIFIGDGGTSGSLTGPMTNQGVVRFNRTDNFTHAGNITGAGRIEQIGGGTVTLSGNNPFTGTTTISNGTINVTSFTAIGSATAAVDILAGGALDLAGIPTANVAGGFGTNKEIHIQGTGVGGTGAITNSGTLSQQNAFQKIHVFANATIGGTGRYDLRGTEPVLDLHGNTLTKIGANQFSVVSGTIHAGNIVVNDGFFQIESASNVTESGTITVNSPGTLRFHQLGNGGGDGMSMAVALNGGTISDNNQTHLTTIASPISMTGDANTFNINASTGFTFTGDISGTGGMTKTGEGLMILAGANNSFTGPLAASNGKLLLDTNQVGSSATTVSGDAVVELSESAGFNRILKTGVISTSGTSKIDIKNNKILTSTPVGTFTGGAYTGLQGEVQKAYDFGSWDLPGLMTSEPNAGPLVGTTTIGISDGATVAFLAPTETGLFAGQTITGATTLAVYTYAGDVNFDGLVDASDYGIIDNYFQFPGTTGYANGDFNYDGIIDAGDYGIIDNTFQLQGAPIPMTGGVASTAAGLSGVTAVPEPTSLSVLGIAGAAMLGARRRRRRSTNASQA